MTDQRKVTCVALYDKEMVMATGDISGRIIVWHKFTELSREYSFKTVYHWHTLPVNCFSTKGILIIFYFIFQKYFCIPHFTCAECRSGILIAI